MASLDPEACKKYNVAARWALRQSGVVRARCEEYDPSELQGIEEVTTKNEDGATVVVTAADPFAGLVKLLKALEEMIGKSELDRKGELRARFYVEIRRQACERISAFCTRFRTLAADLKREGGLDPLRRQLLETAPAGREGYDEIEAEVLRLFRDLHIANPLFNKQRTSNDKGILMNRFLWQHHHHGPHSHRTSAFIRKFI